MAFVLPAGFATEVNEFVKRVREYESSPDPNEQAAKLRAALVSACHFLNSLDLQELQLNLDEIKQQAGPSKEWQDSILGSEGHFNYFLENVENGILKGVRIDKGARDRIKVELRQLRKMSAIADIDQLWSGIVTSIGNLRREICSLKDQEIEHAKLKTARHKLVKTLCTVVIVTNAVGSAYYPPASFAALAASVTLGGVSQRIPEPK